MIEFIMQMLNDLKFVFHEINDFSHENIFAIFLKKMMILHFISQNFLFKRIKFFNDHKK